MPRLFRDPRLWLAVGSFLGAALLLEGAVRVLVPLPAPVRLRDGLYVSQLPLVNGRLGRWVTQVEGLPLLREKAPGELRLFFFGESSVQGEPWGYPGSPVTMLHEQLRAANPERRITVVNMGRGAAFTMDTYYYLLAAAPFSPDYVVLYLGANDLYQGDFEMCLPARLAPAHRAWRALVSRSRLLWLVRALGPDRLVASTGPAAPPPIGTQACDGAVAFARWSEILVEAGLATGARVAVTTPVHNSLKIYSHAGPPSRQDVRQLVAELSPMARRLATCVLSDGCEVAAAITAERTSSSPHLAATDVAPGGPWEWIDARAETWRRVAARKGVELLDFNAVLKAANFGEMGPPFIVDEVHLSLEGYAMLASTWARWLEREAGLRAGASGVDLSRYPGDIRAVRGDLGCLSLVPALFYLREGPAPLLGLHLLRMALAAGDSNEWARTTAHQLLSALGRGVGLEADAAAADAGERLAFADLARVAAERCRPEGRPPTTPGRPLR